jgi:DNA-directed RNA polymerase I, II, and III subunit RPABC5
MIIPIKCFTCGNVLADKYRCYLETVAARKGDEPTTTYFTPGEFAAKKSVEGEVLDALGLTKPCCRRHMLTHVDIE